MIEAAERVLGVPRSSLPDQAAWHGLRLEGLADFEALVGRVGGFRDRPEAEVDPSWKQVIPYLVLRDGDRFFLMRRTTAGGDARLHDRYSIGVGGHLNPGDGDLVGGLRREWHEELVADFEPAFQLLGLLNDDTTDVGSVHIGAVYTADAMGRPVAIRETHKLEGRFATIEEVAAVADRLETWSQLVFEVLTGGSGMHGPAPGL